MPPRFTHRVDHTSARPHLTSSHSAASTHTLDALYSMTPHELRLCGDQVFLAQGVGVGLGVGLLFLPSLSIVSHHFRARRAIATGIVVSGASCGGIVFPIMLNHLFANPKIGFANGVRLSGGVIAVLLGIANGIMRTRLPPKRRGLAAVFNAEVMRRIVSDGAYAWSAAG